MDGVCRCIFSSGCEELPPERMYGVRRHEVGREDLGALGLERRADEEPPVKFSW